MSTSSLPLSAFSTCEISDALIKLGIVHGGLIPDIHMFSPSPPSDSTICAPAYTVQMVPASLSEKVAPKLPFHFVDTVPQGSVIVISAPLEAQNAVWGGLMTAGALSRGAVGVIISGRCRDLAEHRLAQFPVFARGSSTLGQSPFTRPSAVNVPLVIYPQAVTPKLMDEFPPVVVRPGDWMIADENGVVCVPSELEDKVAALATTGREVDGRCLEDIKAGKGVQASFKRHRGK